MTHVPLILALSTSSFAEREVAAEIRRARQPWPRRLSLWRATGDDRSVR